MQPLNSKQALPRRRRILPNPEGWPSWSTAGSQGPQSPQVGLLVVLVLAHFLFVLLYINPQTDSLGAAQRTGKSEWELARQSFAASSRIARETIAGDSLCSQAGCHRTDAVRCAYVDRREQLCLATACPAHQVVQHGRANSPQHAATLVAVGLDAPLAARPDLDNAAPALVSWMFRDLHDPVTAVMEELARYEEGETITVDALARVSHTEEGRRWSQGWRLIAHTGTLFSVAVEVHEIRPRNVIVRVGTHNLVDAVPPWLVPGAADDDEARSSFVAQVVDGIASMAERERRTDRARAALRS